MAASTCIHVDAKVASTKERPIQKARAIPKSIRSERMPPEMDPKRDQAEFSSVASPKRPSQPSRVQCRRSRHRCAADRPGACATRMPVCAEQGTQRQYQAISTTVCHTGADRSGRGSGEVGVNCELVAFSGCTSYSPIDEITIGDGRKPKHANRDHCGKTQKGHVRISCQSVSTR